MTEVATSTTPRTVMAKPYHRVEENEEDIKVAVKERNLPVIEKIVEVVKPSVADGTKPNIDPNAEKTWEKRYADLRSYSAKKENEFKKQLEDLRTEVAQNKAKAVVTNLPKTPEEVKVWADTYKDTYDMIKTIAVGETQVQLDALQAQIDQLTTTNEQTTQEKAEAILTSLVPDWRELDADIEFHAWLNEDSRKSWKNIVYNSNNSHEIAEILITYKERMGKNKNVDILKPRKPDVNAALTVTNSKGADVKDNANSEGEIIRESEVKALTRKQYEQYEDMIDAAIKEGRFVYDISGKK